MLTKYQHEKVVWIDLESPTAEEIARVRDAYGLHPVVVGELASPSARQKADFYGNLVYMIFHFPVLGRKSDRASAQEIDFVIGKDFLITAHYETIDALYEFSKIFEVNALLARSVWGDHAGFLFFFLMRHLYTSLERQFEFVTDDLRGAEEAIFSRNERKMVEVLSSMNRNILDVRFALKAHRELLSSFESAAPAIWGSDFSYYVKAIAGEYSRLWNLLESNRELLMELRETNDALLTTKMNETMVELTMIASLTLPLTLIAQIFSMNTHTPILGSPEDFWLVIGIMGASTLATFLFFKHRGWL